MNFTELVELKKVEKRLENIVLVRKEIDKAWVQTKINNHLQKFNELFSYQDIYSQILENDLVASMFCKDPSKQNISENLVASELNVPKLPASGRKCVRFDEGGDMISVNRIGATKSADFFMDGVYYTQKYTKEAGGAQDNQYADVVDFLIKGSIKHRVGAIVDGDFWTGKKNLLKTHFSDNPNVKIV